MEYLRYIFIVCYVAYALHKSRSSRIYFLLFPFLIFFGDSAFVYHSAMSSYWFNYLDFEIFALVMVWFITTGPFGEKKKLFASAATKILLLFSALILIDVLLTWISGRSILSAIHLGRDYWYVVLAYLLFQDILMTFTRERVLKFLETLIFINTVLAVFYIVSSGWGINIHGTQKWGQFWVMGSLITRDFATFPGLTSFAFIYYLVHYIAGKKRDSKSFFIIAANFVCTLLLYTRWTTSVIVGLPFLAILLYFTRKKRASRVVSYTLLYVGLLLIVFFSSRQFARSQYTYFRNRVLQVSSVEQLFYDSTLTDRLRMVGTAYDLLEGIHLLVGNGYSGSEVANKFYGRGSLYRPGDIMWAKLIIDMGVAGSFLFALFLILGLKDSFRLFRGPNLFGLVLFLTILSLVISTFLSGAFLLAPLPIFIFSIVVIENGKLWRRKRLELESPQS